MRTTCYESAPSIEDCLLPAVFSAYTGSLVMNEFYITAVQAYPTPELRLALQIHELSPIFLKLDYFLLKKTTCSERLIRPYK